jgi:hypothetical protein
LENRNCIYGHEERNIERERLHCYGYRNELESGGCMLQSVPIVVKRCKDPYSGTYVYTIEI